eukprot:6174340-Pleurochrysis_carterae.AAC.4
MFTSSRRTMKQLRGEVGVALEQARLTLHESHLQKAQLNNESGKRHEMANRVHELEGQMRKLKDELRGARRESAAREDIAHQFEAKYEKTKEKLESATAEYKKRARAGVEAKAQKKKAEQAQTSKADLASDNSELRKQLDAAKVELSEVEGRIKQFISDHTHELEEAAAAAAAEAAAEAEEVAAEAAKAAAEERAAMAQFVPPKRPGREHLAQLSKAPQSQVRQADLMCGEREPQARVVGLVRATATNSLCCSDFGDDCTASWSNRAPRPRRRLQIDCQIGHHQHH